MSSSLRKEPEDSQSTTKEESEIDWRSSCNSQETRKLYALDHGLFSDVSFAVGSKGEVIRGHSQILCMGSPVFQAHLSGKSLFGSPIPIPNIQPNGFRHLLKYFYTDKVPEIPDEDYIEFFKAVKCFKVEELYKVCREHLLKKLALGNAIDVYENCKVLEEKELEKAADKFIKKSARSILAQPKFSKLSAENLLHFISSDDFSAPEVPLCLAVYKWGEAECERQKLEMKPENLRLVLKDVIPQIRFPLMNPSDFSLKIVPLNLLTLEETVAIFLYFNVAQNDRHKIPDGGRFISKPRVHVNYEDEDKMDKVVWTLDGINTGLRTDTIYTISNKGVVSANYLNVCARGYGLVAKNNLATYEFEGERYLSTFWGIRRGSEPNSYSLFTKCRNGYLTRMANNSSQTFGREHIEFQNLTFEPSKNDPGCFRMTTASKSRSGEYMILGLSKDPIEDGFYAEFMKKPEEEVDSIFWKIQKIQI